MAATGSSSSANLLSNLTRMPGLASGLTDTENMVKAMAMAARQRYNRKAQKLQTLQWRQEAYRKQISALSSFQDKYLSLTSSSSVKAYSSMSKYLATASDSKVTATASSTAKEAIYTITGSSAATKASITGDAGLIENCIKINFDNFDKIDDNYTSALDAFSTAETDLQAAGEEYEALSQLYDEDQLAALSDEDREAHLTAVEEAKEKFTTVEKNYLDAQKALQTAEDEYTNGKSLTLNVTLNGTSKNITFSGKSKGEAIASFEDALNAGFNSTTDKYFEVDENGKMTYADNTGSGITHTFSIKNNTYVGLNNDAFSKVNTDATLGSIAFATGLQASRTVTTTYTLDNYLFDEDKGYFDVKEDNSGTLITDPDFKGNVAVPETKTVNYYDMEIAGKTFSFTDSTTIQEMLNTVNNAGLGVTMSYSTFNQSFKLETQDTGANQSLEAGNTLVEGSSFPDTQEVKAWQRYESGSSETEKYVAVINSTSTVTENTDGNIYNVLFGEDPSRVEGKDSTITLLDENGDEVTYTNATNSYTFDGTTINVAGLKEFDAASEDEYVTVETKKDTAPIKDLIVNFINDYNTLIDGIYKEMSTARPKDQGSYFDPLTEEQEEEMDQDDIDKWNEKAKQGLLYQDGYLSNIYNSLLSAMGSAVGGATLADMGIKSTKWTDNGKLSIDEDKLDEFLNNHSDKAIEFFTNPSTGMAYKVDNAISRAIATSGANGSSGVGYLTAVAGREGTRTDKKNALYTEITSMQKLVDSLKQKYEAELDRHWRTFTALEKYINAMNSQAAMFMTDY